MRAATHKDQGWKEEQRDLVKRFIWREPLAITCYLLVREDPQQGCDSFTWPLSEGILWDAAPESRAQHAEDHDGRVSRCPVSLHLQRPCFPCTRRRPRWSEILLGPRRQQEEPAADPPLPRSPGRGWAVNPAYNAGTAGERPR